MFLQLYFKHKKALSLPINILMDEFINLTDDVCPVSLDMELAKVGKSFKVKRW